MKKILKPILIVAALFLNFNLVAQENLTREQAADYAERFNNAGGTYQFQVIDSREKLAIPFSYIENIENARKQNEVTYIYFKDNVRVKVLPYSEISSPGFKAIEKIVYIKSSDL